jgi:hypothetical protein
VAHALACRGEIHLDIHLNIRQVAKKQKDGGMNATTAR